MRLGPVLEKASQTKHGVSQSVFNESAENCSQLMLRAALSESRYIAAKSQRISAIRCADVYGYSMRTTYVIGRALSLCFRDLFWC